MSYFDWWLSKFTDERKHMGGPLLPKRELRITKCECCGRTHETTAKMFNVSYCEDCSESEARWYTYEVNSLSLS